MFELKIASRDASSGTVPISWCLDHETLKVLSENNVEEPQVVIVVAPVNGYHCSKEYRKVVPLQDLMTYIEFRSSGPNRIWGFISLRKVKDVKERYLSRENGEFRTDILSQDGTAWSEPFGVDYNESNAILNSPTVHVEVPEGCFAKEPWAWEKTWVNHFFRGKCVDQCEFRRRRLFAYTVQPLLMFFNIFLIRMYCFVFSLLLAARNMSIKPLIHPLRYSLGDAWDTCCGGSYVINHLPEDDKNHWEPDNVSETFSYIFRSFWSTIFMPMVSIPLAILAWFHCWITLIIIGSILVFGLLVIFVVSAVMTGSLRRWVQWLSGSDKPEEKKKDEEEDDPELWYMKRDEMDMLVCNPDRKPLTLASLPAKKRTMRLRFMDLKSKVCRPFSV